MPAACLENRTEREDLPCAHARLEPCFERCGLTGLARAWGALLEHRRRTRCFRCSRPIGPRRVRGGAPGRMPSWRAVAMACAEKTLAQRFLARAPDPRQHSVACVWCGHP